MRSWQFLNWTNIHYIKQKRETVTASLFCFLFCRFKNCTHFFENGICKKRRIRFLTDAKIGVLSLLSVVVFVVLEVVLASRGGFNLCFKAQDRNRDLPKDGSGGFF